MPSAADPKTFFAEAPLLRLNASQITGTVCGVRVEAIADPLMRNIRYMDKLVDELANGQVDGEDSAFMTLPVKTAGEDIVCLGNIRAVLFDLDGTLLDRQRSLERFLRDQWRRFFADLQPVDQTQYIRTTIELDHDGQTPGRRLFGAMVTRFGLSADLADALTIDFRAGFPASCVLFPDASLTLSSLRQAGLKLGLITNGSVRMQSLKLESLALSTMFDDMLISDAEGISKPDPRIFHRALQRLDVEPAHACFVGDHPECDVQGAHGSGMRAIWRRRSGVARPAEADAVIHELSDLLPLLGIRRA